MPALTVRLALGVVLAALLTSCGGDNEPTGPSASFAFDGTWTYSVNDANSGQTTCDAGPYNLVFTTNGGTTSGTIASNASTKLRCTHNGQMQVVDVTGNGPLTSLTRNGSAVSFGYTTSNGPASITGTIQDDNRMTGQGTITVGVQGSPLTLSGSWVATRQ